MIPLIYAPSREKAGDEFDRGIMFRADRLLGLNLHRGAQLIGGIEVLGR